MRIPGLWNSYVQVSAAILCASALALIWPPLADAQVGEPGLVDSGTGVLVVNSAADTPDVDLTDGVCAIDQGTTLCTLRAAVQQANAIRGHNTITFALPTATTITLASAIVISDSLAIQGPGIDRLTVTSSGTDRHFVINLLGAAEQVVAITDLTLENGQHARGYGGSIYMTDDLGVGLNQGNATDSQRLELTRVILRNNYAFAGEGGALAIERRTTTELAAFLTDVTFEGNHAIGSGGAISVRGTDLTVVNSRFQDNRSREHGGAIYCLGVNRATIIGSTFTANGTEQGRDGGAIHCSAGNVIMISASIFTANGADDDGFERATANGGALFLEAAAATVTQSTFSRNYVYRKGGAIANIGALTIVASEFHENRSDESGGALFTRTPNPLSLADNRFIDNRSGQDGGAIDNQGGDLSISGGELRDNFAEEDGGAIYNIPLTAQGSLLSITASRLTGNEAYGDGGAIYNGASEAVTGTAVFTTLVTINATALISNSAGAAGGALYSMADADSERSGIRRHHVTIAAGTELSQNNASDAGGALFITDGALTVADSTLRDNTVSGDLGGGGAIAAVVSTVQITNSELTDNQAELEAGGAIMLHTSRAEISASRFLRNRAPRNRGGAIACVADALNHSIINLTIHDALFQENQGDTGGALALLRCTWAMSTTQVENNQATNGGGIHSMYSSGAIHDSTLVANQAPDGNGGAIHLNAVAAQLLGVLPQTSGGVADNGATLEIVNSTLQENVAGAYGGALFNQSATVTITASTFRANQVNGSIIRLQSNAAADGGSNAGGGAILNNGVLTLNQSSLRDNQSAQWGGALMNVATAFITNSTLSGNRADATGAAIYNQANFLDQPAAVTIIHSTITKNQAGAGGALVSEDMISEAITTGLTTLVIGSSIVAGNTVDGVAADCLLAGAVAPTSFTSLDYNITTLVLEPTCPFDRPHDQRLPAEEIFTRVLDEQLADHGGPTPTHALVSGSLAVDLAPHGVNDCGATVATDQRGMARPIGAACDSGAYEAIQLGLAVTKTVGTDPTGCAATTALTARGGANLYYCLTIKNSDHITISALQISDASVALAGFPYTVTVAPGQAVQIPHTAIAAFGALTATRSNTTTIEVTAATAPLPLTGERLMAQAVATTTVAVIPVYTIILTQTAPVNPVGLLQTIRATVFDHNHDPAAALPITFTVQGTNGVTDTTTTDSTGAAPFVYTAITNRAVIDLITATTADPPTPAAASPVVAITASAVITAGWRPITVTVHGVGDGTATVVDRTVTARVKTVDDEAPVDGVQVGFAVTGANVVPTQTQVTAAGQAVFTYTSYAPAASRRQPALTQRRTTLILVAYAPTQQQQIPADSAWDTIIVWVDLIRNGQHDAGEPLQLVRVPAAITLVSLVAQPNADGSITVTWRTAVELDNVGFNLYRAPTLAGPYTQVNDQLIAAQGMGMAMGATYHYRDSPPTAGPYYYRLEDVDFAGVRTQHPPVRSDDAPSAAP